MTFSPDSVNFAIKKLEELRDSIVDFLHDEEAQEAEALEAFININNELEAYQS